MQVDSLREDVSLVGDISLGFRGKGTMNSPVSIIFTGQDLRDMAKVTSTTEEQIDFYDSFENDEEEVRKEYLETKNAKRYINKEKKLKSSLEEKEKNKNEKKKRKLDLKNGKAVKKARSSGEDNK